MTNTRAASATVSLRAKQELVRMLFGADLVRKGPQAHRRLDHAVYSHSDLRTAYLRRAHEVHPDKRGSHLSTSKATSGATGFVELQEAWNRYNEQAKWMKKVASDDNAREVSSNFTMFGVGCSFSDNELERESRARIMDEASRGWFSAGTVSDGNSGKNGCDSDHCSSKRSPSLASDDLFEKACVSREVPVENERPARSSLVDHLIPPHRR